MADFFDALGETLLDVGKSIGNAYANTLGNSSAALETTTAADDSDKITIGGVTVTPLGIVVTVGGILGAIVLASFATKMLKA